MDDSPGFYDYLQLNNSMDQLYHQIAVELGLPDSVLSLLYTLWEEGDGLTPSLLYNEWTLTKQTGHSGLMWLKSRGFVRLIPGREDRRSKTVSLTDRGREYARQVIVPLIQAEERAFQTLAPREQTALISLTEKTLCKLKEEMAALDLSAKKALL